MLGLPYNTTVVLIGTALVGAMAGLVGTFAMLRRRALTGDALAHASLPGVCIGYYLAGGQNLPMQFAGAMATGLVAVWLVRNLPRVSKTRSETAIAGVLSVFFGAGVVLTRMIQNSGKFGGRAGFDAFLFGSPGSLLVQDVYLIAGVCLIVMATLMATFRLSVAVTFDAAFLQSQGVSTRLLDWLHLLLLTTAIVVGLPAIGVVMIVALIITPAATARMCSDRFGVVLGLAAVLGAIASASGAFLSSLDTRVPAGAASVLVATTLFLVTLATRRVVLLRATDFAVSSSPQSNGGQ